MATTRKEESSNRMPISVSKIIENVCEDICNNYCKYRPTCDENCECDIIRSGKECPLDRLQ